MIRLLPVLVCTALLFASLSASAQSLSNAPGTFAQPSATVTESSTVYDPGYRRQIAITDAVAGGLFVGGATMLLGCVLGDGDGSDSNCTIAGFGLFGGLGTYALGSGIIHLKEGNPGRALASVGLRVGLPALAIGLANESDDGGILVLGSIGAALMIDWFVLADGPSKRPRKPLAVAPSAAPTQGGATFGVAGHF